MNTQEKIAHLLSPTMFAQLCFELWTAHGDWIGLWWPDATKVVEPHPPAQEFGHEMVDLLSRYIHETGRVNAHIGLTSSDICDNVRLMQLQRSLAVLHSDVWDMVQMLHTVCRDKGNTTAYTHWQPAARIAWSHRAAAWTNPLYSFMRSTPLMRAKRFGGPTGDAFSLSRFVPREEHDTFPWTKFALVEPSNLTPLQSTDWVCEYEAMAWCALVAAQVHKIATDLRFLFSAGEVTLGQPVRAGSSSMPHKINPFKWEKVCSICRDVGTAPQAVWQCMAHNGLERTLDGSWLWKRTMERALFGLAEALQIMIDTKFDVVKCAILIPVSEEQLTTEVLAGKDRWPAYLESLAQHK